MITIDGSWQRATASYPGILRAGGSRSQAGKGHFETDWKVALHLSFYQVALPF